MEHKPTAKSGILTSFGKGLRSTAEKVRAYVAAKAIGRVEQFVVNWIKPVLQWLQKRWRVIRPARVGLILSIAVSLFVYFNEQAKDILRVIAQTDWWNTANWLLCCGLIIYAFSAWYLSRAALYVSYPSFTPPHSDKEFETYRKYTARFVGGFPIAFVALAFVNVSWSHAVFYFAVTAVFIILLKLRRDYLLPKLYPPKDNSEKYEVRLHKDEGLPSRTRRVVYGVNTIAIVVFVLILLMPVSFPTFIGTLAMIFLGASGLVVMLTLLSYWSDYYDLPSLILILLVTAVFAGLYNDNHEVRTLRDTLDPDARSTLAEHFETWMQKRLKRAAGDTMEYPVFVVAAEGGGIRAAYWTATMLNELQQNFPDFPCHVFAISGVSGGSLGGSAFVTDVANSYRAGEFKCTDPDETGQRGVDAQWKNKPMRPTSVAFLGEDFLAPTVAGLLFPDLLSRVNIFCPWLFCLPDRAKYLEWAWEENWRKHNKGAPLQFSGNFLDLWKSGGDFEVPSLVLNGTWVEDGRRTLTSNLIPEADKLADVDDMLTNFDKTLPLSTAVHMSARFTYVSPAGTIRTEEEGRKRVVDGGYFENSGALSARQILDVLRDICTTNADLLKVGCNQKAKFYGIIISNNPDSPNAADGRRLAAIRDAAQQQHPQPPITDANRAHDESNEDSDDSGWFPVLSETLSPVLALYHVRTARGSLSEKELVAALGDTNSFRFQLYNPPDKKEKIPLGWVLSNKTQAEIRGQAKSRVDEYRAKLQATGLRAAGEQSWKESSWR